ncbi:hypothetical protein JVT61DRAFT_4090 [Boletus reticuloceps]|uniref:Uncharacterized protein n=1 Tax=Boletus reticuloceps TaxID=495285 RepID=A0A8I3A9M1_9AGAM|nr:hypothetical protein JVT61DRAFT_4090 [Boletus reticuloceps]
MNSGSGTGTGEERPQNDPSMSPYGTLTNGMQTLSTSNPYPHYAEQEQEEEEKSGPEEQPQDGPSCPGYAREQGKEEQSASEDQSQSEFLFPVSAAQQGREENPRPGNQSQDGPPLSDSALQTDENEETVITSAGSFFYTGEKTDNKVDIRARDIALGLRRLPAGFYIVVHHSGLEWRTNNEPSSANDDVEWNGPIPLPSDLTASICLEIYASFEFQPMLGSGEQLRELTVTVGQLLDRSANEGREWD